MAAPHQHGNSAYTLSPDFFGKVKGEQGAQVDTLEMRHSLNLQWRHIVGSTFTVPATVVITPTIQ